jgi:hypothetical protein
LAGVRERIGRAAYRHRRLRPSDEDRVRARNDRVPSAICRAFNSRGERMTAYLISLALLGLVAIVVAEILS